MRFWYLRTWEGEEGASVTTALQSWSEWDVYQRRLIFNFCVHSWCHGIALLPHQFKSGDWKWFYQMRRRVSIQEPHHGRVKLPPILCVQSRTSLQLSCCSSWFLKMKMNQHTVTEEDVADANKGKPVVAVSMASGIYISCSCLIVNSRCVADFIVKSGSRLFQTCGTSG